MAWGFGTTVADTEAYAGPGAEGVGFVEQVQDVPVVEEEPTISVGNFLNNLKVSDKFSFYLDDSQFGVTYTDSPFQANVNVGQGGQTNWGASVSERMGPFGARIGILGQGTSGTVSPYADLNVNPVPGLNFDLHAQSYPGGYTELSPSASYQNQFDTPWGPVDYSIGRQDGRTSGRLQIRGDF